MNPTTVEADVDVESSSSLPRSEGAAKETTMTSQKQTHDSSDKEDGTTTPPTKTLKQTTISDKQDIDTSGSREGEEADLPTDTETGTILATTKTSKTADVDDEDMREQIASPKKKRGREIDDDAGQDVGEEVLSEEESTSTNTSVVNGGRTTRSAPEKKRPRDTSVPPPTFSADTPNEESAPISTENQHKNVTSSSTGSQATSTLTPKPTFGSTSNDKPQTASAAFASSGFGAASAAPSGFAALAGKPSIFGGGSQTSGFGSFGSNKQSAPTSAAPLSFSSAATGSSGFGGVGKSGFGGLGSSGSVLGGGFGSGFTAPIGQKLSSFAAPTGSSAISSAETPKTAKAFGAPESDAEDGSDEEGSDADEVGSDDGASTADDRKRSKLGKVVDDGEAGESTLLQFRAKIFAIESKEKGWKERGVGTLKLNVPRSYVDYDEYTGQPILGSYDPSGREEVDEDENSAEPTAARLIMRQENTHRVVLNTPIIKALKFEEKTSATSVQLMFMAFEDGKPVNTLLRMSETNARLLQAEITSIQSELGA